MGRIPTEGGGAGMTHPDEMVVELYVLGTPPDGPDRDALSRHFEECAACRDLRDMIARFYLDLREEAGPPGQAIPPPARRPLPVRRPSPVPERRGPHHPRGMVETAMPVRVARWMMRHSVASVAGGFGFLGLLALFILRAPSFFSTPDTNPANFHVRGLMLDIVNRSDSVLWSEQVNEGYARELRNQDDAVSPGEVRILIHDVDGDGTNEIIQVRNPGRPDDISAGEVVLRSLGEEGFVWKFPTSKQFNFPRRTEGNTPDYAVRTIRAGDLDGDGKQEVYVLTSHTHFPTWIAKLDAATGEEQALFLNIGHIIMMKAADLDGDGISELIICGRNNAFRKAFFAILDPRRMDGRGPSSGPYIPEGVPPAAIKSYVLFPRTAIGDALDGGDLMEMAVDVDVNREQRYLRVSVTETNASYRRASYAVVFDRSMNAVNFQTGDDFDQLSDTLYTRGLIDRPFGEDDRKAFLSGLMYCSGDSWTTRPVSPLFGQTPAENRTD